MLFDLLPVRRRHGLTEYAQYKHADTLNGLGSAGVSDLNTKQQKRIVASCDEEGITVQQEKALEEWAASEMQRLMQISDEAILRELLGDEVLSAKGELQPDGTTCRKDNCKKYDNPPHSDWKPIIMPPTIKPAEARA